MFDRTRYRPSSEFIRVAEEDWKNRRRLILWRTKRELMTGESPNVIPFPSRRKNNHPEPPEAA